MNWFYKTEEQLQDGTPAIYPNRSKFEELANHTS